MTLYLQSSPHIDYLSRLPNEVLEQIYDDAYINWWRYRTYGVGLNALIDPLSKRLLSLQQRQLYRVVHLQGMSCLSYFVNLMKTVIKKPVLGCLVTSLKIGVSDSWTVIQRLDHTDFEGGRLKRFFELLTEMKSMEIGGGTACHVPGLLECIRCDLLPPKLTTLSVTLGKSDTSALLSLSPRIKQLIVFTLDSTDRPSLPSKILPKFPFSDLTQLSIHRPDLSINTWLEFIALCPSLTNLSLSYSFSTSTHASIVQAIPIPSPLTSLSLVSSRSYLTSGLPDPSVVPFSRLPNLKHLTLGGGGDHSQTLLEVLHHPSIEELTIEPYDPLPSVILLLLVSSSTKNRSLRSIDINSEPAWEGTRIADLNIEEDYEDDADFAADLESAEEIVFQDWKFGEVPDGLSENDLIERRETGFENGITVHGAAYEALEIQVAYDADLEVFRAMWEEWSRDRERKLQE